ncbi:MAG TPA: universal stress protein [Candidatus Omnitrophota bacterium]|nr:universal stress protein [Candidatus Omnitrophota bacterium]HRZ14570.1 universal stress protein [Candidatus Omnitrophota bacterium]
MAIRNIVVSVAGAPGSLVTAKYAIALSKLLGAKLTALYVVNEKVLHELLHTRIFVEAEAQAYARDMEQQGKSFLERLQKMAEQKGVPYEGFLLKGVISDEVINKTKAVQADMLVIGELREVTSVSQLFYDEGERIFRKSHCPVVMVRDQAMVEALFKEI